ncbi:hypothetical protein [Streptomyces sp. NPDC093093]|uniref:hypothetical protein n=1 Tax=Streptomyces sp. NPDC093093 TaxID=3366025 RepID=UPI0037F45C09
MWPDRRGCRLRVEGPAVAAGCKLTGGSWHSAYDNIVISDAAHLDVHHFVPPAEVYDSEQAPWSAARREAYANDQAGPGARLRS